VGGAQLVARVCAALAVHVRLATGRCERVPAGLTLSSKEWHILQEVFVVDLDPDRLAQLRRNRDGAAGESPVWEGIAARQAWLLWLLITVVMIAVALAISRGGGN
jgi:hypothetical protein